MVFADDRFRCWYVFWDLRWLRELMFSVRVMLEKFLLLQGFWRYMNDGYLGGFLSVFSCLEFCDVVM